MNNEFIHTSHVPKYLSPDGFTYISVYRLGSDTTTLRMAASSYTLKGATIIAAMPGVEMQTLTARYVFRSIVLTL